MISTQSASVFPDKWTKLGSNITSCVIQPSGTILVYVGDTAPAPEASVGFSLTSGTMHDMTYVERLGGSIWAKAVKYQSGLTYAASGELEDLTTDPEPDPVVVTISDISYSAERTSENPEKIEYRRGAGALPKGYTVGYYVGPASGGDPEARLTYLNEGTSSITTGDYPGRTYVHVYLFSPENSIVGSAQVASLDPVEVETPIVVDDAPALAYWSEPYSTTLTNTLGSSATVSGLPEGMTATVQSDTFTIQGTPT